MEIPASVVLACPKCGKQYQIDPSLMERKRRVRCRACSAVFVVGREHEPAPDVDEDRILAWLRQSPAEE